MDPSVIAAPQPTGTVSFLFTDIEGSTPLWDADPDGMRVALARHDEILRTAINGADGYVFSTGGDGFGVGFSSASKAVGAAVGAQRLMADEPWPEGVTLRVRMGIHTGEAQERDGDYFGPAVNRAARLMGAAHGGQVAISAVTAGIVADQSDLDLVDLGLSQLKGIVEPVHVYGVSAEGYDWIDKPLVSSLGSAGNLPRPHTEMIGDLPALLRRVAGLTDARITTLTGSGGVGKSRVAIEIGWLVVDEFVDGIWMIELAPIADPEAVIASIASTLSVHAQPGETLVESIVDWCLGRRMLLIVDNCEHVLSPVADLVAAIVSGCPTVTVVATSREPLGIAGERVVRIPSLGEDHARELFVVRATAADSAFVTSPADDDAIASICERLDGIPLAIELTAARIRSLSPVELLDRLDDRFRLLRGGGRGGLERHQTLRATVMWSYRLLSEPERLLFDRVSVFAGGFALEAVEAVCAGGDIDELDIVDLIGELVDKSMIVATRSDSGTRYRLLETLRQYGEERLDERDETVALRDRHLRYYVDLTAKLGAQWLSPEQLVADTAFDADWQNFRTAYGWSITIGSIDEATNLLAATRGHSWSHVRTEVGEWAERLRLELEPSGACPSTVYSVCSTWAFHDGEPERAIALAAQGQSADEDQTGIGFCRSMAQMSLGSLGRLDDMKAGIRGLQATIDSDASLDCRTAAASALANTLIGDPSGAASLAQLEELTCEVASPWHVVDTIRIRGLHKAMSAMAPDIEGAIADFRETLELRRESGSDTSWAQMNLAYAMAVAKESGATEAIRKAVAIAYDVRNWAVIGISIEVAAIVLVHASAHTEATTLYGHLELQPAAWGQAAATFRAESLAMLAPLEDSAVLRAAGAALGRHELVAYTLAALDSLQE